MLSIREYETPHLLMGASEFDGDGKLKNDYCKVRFSEGLVIDVWDTIKRRKDLEDRDCLYSRSYFEKSRKNLDRKEDNRRQNLTSLAWMSVILVAHFFCKTFEGGYEERCDG